MKITLIILTLLCLFSCIESLEEQNTYYSSGQLKEQKFVDKQNRVQGVSYSYFENGNLKIKKNNLNGKTNGIYEEYYSNGKLSAKAHYANGIEIDSTFLYKKTGKLESIILFDKEGKRLKEIIFHPNGIMKEEMALLVGSGIFVSGREYDQEGKIIEDFSEGSPAYANLKYGKSSKGNLLLKVSLKNNPYKDSLKVFVLKNFDFDPFTNPKVIRQISYSGTNKLTIEIMDSDFITNKLNVYIESVKYIDKEKRNSMVKHYYVQIPKEGKRPNNNVHGIYPR